MINRVFRLLRANITNAKSISQAHENTQTIKRFKRQQPQQQQTQFLNKQSTSKLFEPQQFDKEDFHEYLYIHQEEDPFQKYDNEFLVNKAPTKALQNNKKDNFSKQSEKQDNFSSQTLLKSQPKINNQQQLKQTAPEAKKPFLKFDRTKFLEQNKDRHQPKKQFNKQSKDSNKNYSQTKQQNNRKDKYQPKSHFKRQLSQNISLKIFKQQIIKIIKQKEPKMQLSPNDSLVSLLKQLGNTVQNRNLPYYNLAQLCIQLDVVKQLSDQIAQIKKLTPEIQANLSKALVSLIFIYHSKFDKKHTNQQQDFNLSLERKGLTTFLTQIKYLIYHIEPNEIQALSKLMLLYSNAHDSVIKKQNYFQVQKSGLVSCLFKIVSSQVFIPIEIFSQIMFVTTRFSVNNFSGYLKNSFYKFVQRNMRQNWYVKPYHARSLMYSFGKMGIVMDEFERGMKKICQSYAPDAADPTLASKIALSMLNLRMITSKELQEKYPALFADAMVQFSENEMSLLNMVRNEIWDVKYWTSFLSSITPKHFINKYLRVGIPTAFHHIHILSPSIPPQRRQIIMRQIKRIENLPVYHKVNMKMQSVHCELFETQMNTSINGFQNQVWRILRRIGINVEHQRVISGFRVDLVFPKRKLIVELNGDDHYLKNLNGAQMTPYLNNISFFKIKILKLAGHRIQEIMLNNKSNAANVSLDIMKILEKYPIIEEIEGTEYRNVHK